MTVTKPWDLLPAPNPAETSYPEDFFYNNVARPLVLDTVRVMLNGLPIDLHKVQELESVLDETLSRIHTTLASNPIVQRYLSIKHRALTEEYISLQQSKLKTPSDFLKPFKHSDMTHRSYFMHCFIQGKNITPPDDLLPSGIPKWTAKDVKPFTSRYLVLDQLLKGTIPSNNTFVIESMLLLATHKCSLYNSTYESNISSLSQLDYPQFNPASSADKHYILVDMLGYESTVYTDAYKDYERALNSYIRYGRGFQPEEPKLKYSWPRNEIKALLSQTSDPDEIELFTALMDFSMSAIIKNNFIKAFYEHTHNGRLYGSYTLLGAKTGRYTSSDPLNKLGFILVIVCRKNLKRRNP